MSRVVLRVVCAVGVVSEDVEELRPVERYLAVLCQVEGVLLGCGDVDDEHASLPLLEEGHHTRCLHCQPALLPKPELSQLAHTPGPHIAFVVHRHPVVIPCYCFSVMCAVVRAAICDVSQKKIRVEAYLPQLMATTRCASSPPVICAGRAEYGGRSAAESPQWLGPSWPDSLSPQAHTRLNSIPPSLWLAMTMFQSKHDAIASMRFPSRPLTGTGAGQNRVISPAISAHIPLG